MPPRFPIRTAGDHDRPGVSGTGSPGSLGGHTRTIAVLSDGTGTTGATGQSREPAHRQVGRRHDELFSSDTPEWVTGHLQSRITTQSSATGASVTPSV